MSNSYVCASPQLLLLHVCIRKLKYTRIDHFFTISKKKWSIVSGFSTLLSLYVGWITLDNIIGHYTAMTIDMAKDLELIELV